MHLSPSIRNGQSCKLQIVYECVLLFSNMLSIRGVLWLDTLLQLVSAGEVSAIWAMTAGIMTDRVAGNAAGVRCLCKHSTYLALATATAAAGAAAVGVTATPTAMDWLLTWSLGQCYRSRAVRAFLGLCWAVSQADFEAPPPAQARNAWSMLVAWVCTSAFALALVEGGLAIAARTSQQEGEANGTGVKDEAQQATARTKRYPCFTLGQGATHMRRQNKKFFATGMSGTHTLEVAETTWRPKVLLGGVRAEGWAPQGPAHAPRHDRHLL